MWHRSDSIGVSVARSLLVLMVVVLASSACGSNGGTATSEPSATPASTTTTQPLEDLTTTTAATTTTTTTLAPATTTEPPPTTTTTRRLVYASDADPDSDETWMLDLYAPIADGDWPVMVFIPGHTETRGDHSELLEAVAAEGVLVFAIDYPEASFTSALGDDAEGYREMAESVTCALRYAKETAVNQGSEATPLVLGGFSLGGAPAAHVALAGDRIADLWDAYSAAKGGLSPRVECEAAETAAHVDALTGWAGAYDGFVGYEGLYGKEFLQQNDPELWETLFGAVDSNPDLVIRLLHGDSDSTIPLVNSVAFFDTLIEAGADVTLTEFSGGHWMPHDESLALIMSVLDDW